LFARVRDAEFYRVTCASNTAIPKDILCGGKPCVASITISAPIIEEEHCVAHANVAPVDIPKAKADGPYITDGRAGKSADVLDYKPGACEPTGGELLRALCLRHLT
jgi:hypothetical protein